MPDLSVIILTFNEHQHLERAVRSIQPYCRAIFVVDSYSTDGTVELARELGCQVLENAWVNYATQFNHAIDHCPIKTRWVMRLDADEWVNDELGRSLTEKLDALPEDVTGLRIARRMVFLGRWMRRGGVGERMMLRLWRSGRARCEQRWMDEHMIVDGGRVESLPGAIVDENLNSLTWWTGKHNSYASREAVDALLQERGQAAAEPAGSDVPLEGQARRIRFYKKHLFNRLPPVVRSGMLFGFRYFAMLGFLDGIPGLYFHFLQSFWYRALVDAKIYEVKKAMRERGLTLEQAVEDRLGIKL
ncbi:MAG: glycosyltransferase family 2 protein [Phycisphaeraceae bacterium]|nr:glycosyltransferase family 2 protein [Phycisphaeraceae bacterium]